MMVQALQYTKFKMEQQNKRYWISITLLTLAIVWVAIGLSIFVTGQQKSLGDDFILFQNITIIQNCDCSYVNFTSIINPSGEVILNNVEAVQNGTRFSFLTNGTLNNQIGFYIVTGEGNTTQQGIKTFSYTYEIRQQGGFFGVDFNEPLQLLFLGILVLVAIGLFISKQNFYLGILIFFFGLLAGLNGTRWFLSVPLLFVGIVLTISGYKEVKR